MTRIPLVDLRAQYERIKPEVDAALQRVIDNTAFILGPEVAAFEDAFARYLRAGGAVGVASGSAALHLALRACGVGPGDEVITTAHTFIATVEAIVQVGAQPIFVDIDPRTYTIDPDQVERAITARTRAILPVHLYGHPADMDALRAIAARHSLRLVEDAAQAHGARAGQTYCGTFGDLACFSFYPGKNLGAFGDAGAVTGTDTALLERVRMLRDHGRTSKYEHQEIGFGERLDAVQAAVLRAKLSHLEAWTEARRAHARQYTARLADADVITPYEAPSARHVYHLYVIRTPRRDALYAHLQSKGIGAGIHYPLPIHRQRAYLKQGYGEISLPVTEQVAREVVSLPLYPELDEEQLQTVVHAVREVTAR
jgi:dTDP-4-amino-4,6-dideoxygalactose transaminase